MIKSYNLPERLVAWLKWEGEKSLRGASGELRWILEREQDRRWESREKEAGDEPTGVAEVRLADGVKIPDNLIVEDPRLGNDLKFAYPEPGHGIEGLQVPVPFRKLKDGEESTADKLKLKFKATTVGDFEIEEKMREALEPVKEELKEAVDEIILTGGLRAGKMEKIRDLAKKIPGVQVASSIVTVPKDDPSVELAENGMLPGIAKKRPEETEGRVTLVKGFWKEEYSSKKMAELSAESMGWKPGEYEIKLVK